jgi:hypothetical protein
VPARSFRIHAEDADPLVLIDIIQIGTEPVLDELDRPFADAAGIRAEPAV